MDGEPDPDIELLRRWQTGEAAAGNRLCKQYEEVLRRFLATKVPWAEVDELVQQTWLAMSRARSTIALDAAVVDADRARRIGNFRGYLFGIARHMVLAYYKARTRHRGVELDPEVESLVTLEPSISQRLSLQRHLQWVELALQSLPLELQLLFEGHYLEDLSGSELALVLAVPEGTVRSRLRKARQLLNEALDRLKAGTAARA